MNYIRYFENLEKYNMSFRKNDSAMSARAKTSQKTRRLTVCAMLCALSVIILLLGNLIGVADYSALLIVSMGTVFCTIEMGSFYPFILWLAVSVLSFVILPDKVVAAEYFLFAGIYPVVKRYTFRFRQPFRFIIRLLFFNICAVLCYVAARFIFCVPDEAGRILWIVTYVLFNIVFIVYDACLNSFISFYLLKLRSKIHGDRI